MKKNNNKFYVTTPLYYVNSKPHLGTLYSTLLADVAARWNKILGKNVFFLTGTDEHGQKIAEKAKQEGMEPKEFVDLMVPKFKDVWKTYELEYDKFIRTTDSDHESAVVSWIKKLQDNGDIYKSTYTGWYCVPCETFVLPGEEGEKKCPSCSRELKEIEEENYFFRLSGYQDRLLKFYEDNPNFIVPKERLNEVVSFVKSGLQDLSISRRGVKWGIPFPGDPEQTVYVWADALNNYVSAVGYGSDDPKKQEEFNYWWPANIHIIGKDILRFHAVFWPAFLMAADIPLPKKLLVHGYILSGESKMSKSLGNVVDPDDLAKVYGVEPVRYYLTRQMSISQDGRFDIDSLEKRIGGDLSNNLGNLLSRTVALALNNGLNEVVAPEAFEPESVALHERCEEAYRDYWDYMNHYQYHIALSHLWNFISEVNAYFNDQKPWALAKENKELFEETISATCHSLYTIATLLWPVMPKKMEELLFCIGYSLDLNKDYEEELRKNVWNKKFKLRKPDKPLFVRPEKREDKMEKKQGERKENKEETKEKGELENIKIDDFVKVHLVVGEILSCDEVEGSNKLYKLSVDLGEYGKRQVLAGVKKYFKLEDLIGKQGIYVANLAPRKILGLESQGMMLFSKDDKGMHIVTVGTPSKNGTRLS